ncbi:hypothetical protein J4P02_29390 [Pseudomonas sp. NFXW11]
MATIDRATPLARHPWQHRLAQLGLLYLGALLTLACTTALVLELAHG